MYQANATSGERVVGSVGCMGSCSDEVWQRTWVVKGEYLAPNLVKMNTRSPSLCSHWGKQWSRKGARGLDAYLPLGCTAQHTTSWNCLELMVQKTAHTVTPNDLTTGPDGYLPLQHCTQWKKTHLISTGFGSGLSFSLWFLDWHGQLKVQPSTATCKTCNVPLNKKGSGWCVREQRAGTVSCTGNMKHSQKLKEKEKKKKKKQQREGDPSSGDFSRLRPCTAEALWSFA